MGGSITTLDDLLLDQLRDIYSVECQLVPALEELASMCASQPLRQILEQHVEKTYRQKERLERIGRERGWDLGGDTSKAMEGLISGGRAHIKEVSFPPASDLLIVAHSHRIQHYELAAYMVTIALADRVGLEAEAKLLRASRDEEQQLDEVLKKLAEEELMGSVPVGA